MIPNPPLIISKHPMAQVPEAIRVSPAMPVITEPIASLVPTPSKLPKLSKKQYGENLLQRGII